MTTTRARTDDRTGPVPLDRPDWLDVEEFPFESRVVDLGGNRVHYVDEGDGPVLLFVHAGPAWSFVFRDVVAELRHDYRCIALDFPGTGLSEAAAGYAPTIEVASTVLDSFLDALDLRRVTAVVHDVGGPVTLGVAARAPQRFDGFAIVGSFGWPLAGEFPRVARFIRLVSGTAFGVVNTNLNLLARLTATRFGVGRRLSRPGRRVFLGPFASRGRRRNGLAMLASALESDEYLERVEAALRSDLAAHPVLLLFGEGDDGRKAGFQDRWETLYPDARSEIVEGANHFPMADKPLAVAETIAAWHRERVGAGAG